MFCLAEIQWGTEEQCGDAVGGGKKGKGKLRSAPNILEVTPTFPIVHFL